VRRTWWYVATTKDKGNAADGRFSATCHNSDFNECHDNGYIDQGYRDELKSDAYQLMKVLNGYIASIKRQKSKSIND